MAGGKHKLSQRFVDSVTKAGHHSDGHGLYLIVRKSGSKSWSFLWIRQSIRREMGLGGLSIVSLEQARTKADIIRQQLGRGLDPFVERSVIRTKPFGVVADMVLAELSKGWTNKKHGAQWKRALNVLSEPLRHKNVDCITTSDILEVLKPVMLKSPETGRRLRSRIERVLDFARAHNWRTGENPARWKGHLENILINTAKGPKKHFAAMAYQDVPTLMADLRNNDAMSAIALQFTILTASRTSETLGAKWSEIDIENGIWKIPAERMKMRREHTVPLSSGVISILEKLSTERRSDFIFYGMKANKPLSNMAMTMALRRIGAGEYTVHGFRSSFRDFAGDKTTVSREVAEAALAHRVGNAVEAAYRRGNALEKRRELMELWNSHCDNSLSGEIVRLHAKS